MIALAGQMDKMPMAIMASRLFLARQSDYSEPSTYQNGLGFMDKTTHHAVQITSQTFSALDDLNAAMGSHATWLKDLIRSLLCKESPDPANLADDAHHLCKFGQWYDRDGKALFKDEPLFEDLDDRHHAMHDAARAMLRRHAMGEPIDPGEYNRFMDLAISFQLESRQLQYTLLQRVCAVDQLTGAGNRYALFHRLIEEKERAARTERPCVIALMDMDYFKQVNDSHGHVAGDTVLQTVAQFASRSIRKYDSIYRYGGEEFLICLPNSDLKTAEKRMNHLREDLAALEIEIAPGATIKMTASFGLGYLQPGYPIQDSIQHADAALLRAKDGGRNRVEVADWR